MGNKALKAIGIVGLYKNWSLVFFDYLHLLRKPEVIYTLRNGIKFRARPMTSDKGLINAICLDRVYTPLGYEIHKGDIVVDIGAQIGIFSIFAATYVKDVKIYSYEPFSRNFDLLKENIKLNGLTNVEPFRLAVGAKNNTRSLYICDDNTGGHSLFRNCLSSQQSRCQTEEVHCISLEDMFSRNGIEKIDLLKIDTEGGEYEILCNASADTLRRISKISMEYHEFQGDRHNYCYKDLEELLVKSGFELNHVEDPSGRIGYLYAKRPLSF